MITGAVIRILSKWITAFVLLGNVSAIAQGEIKSEYQGIQLSFAGTNAVLTTNEINTLLLLAKAQGISDVSKIETRIFDPATFRSITVYEREKIFGRLCRYRTLRVGKEEWTKSRWQIAMQRGPFWVTHDAILTRNETLFEEGETQVRIAVSDRVPLQVADQIVDAIKAGRVEFQLARKQTTHAPIKLTQVTSIYPNPALAAEAGTLQPSTANDDSRKLPAQFHLGIKMDPWDLTVVCVRLEDNRLIVLDIKHAII